MRLIEYSRDAVAVLKRMDRATSQRIRAKVQQLAEQPESLANNVVSLKGSKDLKRLRVGDWRVIFTEDLVVVLIVKVAPRGSAYD